MPASVPSPAAGYTGVDVFFVISGYLITGSLKRDPSQRHTDRQRQRTC
jgi:peptidoglycan/LPS O-acetylase OafA/YrhL